MENNFRRQKVARQIQKDLGEIFRSKGMAAYGGAMITVSEVRMTPDLSEARVFLSIFPSDKSEAVIQQVDHENKAIRGELGNRVRHQLRIVPELKFFPDDTLDQLARIDELLKK